MISAPLIPVQKGVPMAHDPQPGYKITATVIESKGYCHAHMKIGDNFPISCHNPNGLCGFFYFSIFPDLQTFEFGGKMPWWDDQVIEVGCPDIANQVILRLERSK